MNKKAMTKQIFTFLMIAILMGFIFLFGMSVIPGLLHQSCEAEKAIFRKSLDDYISNYNSINSRHTETLRLSCDYTKICFLDAERLKQSSSSNIINAPYKIMQDVIDIQGDINIFLVKGEMVEPVTFSDKLKIDTADGYLCINSSGNSFKIIFEGAGRTTIVKAN